MIEDSAAKRELKLLSDASEYAVEWYSDLLEFARLLCWALLPRVLARPADFKNVLRITLTQSWYLAIWPPCAGQAACWGQSRLCSMASSIYASAPAAIRMLRCKTLSRILFLDTGRGSCRPVESWLLQFYSL